MSVWNTGTSMDRNSDPLDMCLPSQIEDAFELRSNFYGAGVVLAFCVRL